MATIKDALSRFRSLSRPSLSSGSTSAYSSYAKKQQSAEDAIIDNQYEAGLLSPESYLGSLQARKVRMTNTPLTTVNLDEKIGKVQEKVQDAKVAQGYSAGEYSTDAVLQYEKEKLAKMTAPGSAAYITQQQKIQQLTDKSEKEKRAATRTSEMLRISKLPDDSSATLWEKARLYQTLSEQARLDGDTQTADQLLTQANNAQVSAKKADVNDIITGARLSVSETPGAGLGVPSSTDGASMFAGLGSDNQGGATGLGEADSSAPGSVTTGFKAGTSSAVTNALKSLDRSYQSYERLVQQKQDKQTLINKYREAIAQSSGDQKTQLTIQLNNLIEGDKQLDNQLSITEQGINDTVVRIQEAQAKAAAGAFSQEVRKNNAEASKIEDSLEKAFAKGEITKEEYISKGTALAAMKSQFYSQSSDVFSQYGNDSSAESYLEKAAQMEEIHQNLVTVGTNLDSYEPISTDPGGKITNIFGKQLQPGEIALTNVQRLKDSGDFDVNYTKDGGVYRRVYYPGQKDLVGDGFISKSVAQELSKNATDPSQSPFVYKENKPTIGPGTGKVEAVPLTKTPGGAWMTPESYQQVKTQANTALDSTLKTLKETSPKTMLESAKKPVANPSLFDKLMSPTGINTSSKPNAVSSAISNLGTGAKGLFDNAVMGAKNLLSKGKDALSGAINSTKSGIQLPEIVKKAYATYDDTTDDQVRAWAERASQETGISPDLIIAQYKLESGNGASAPGNNYFGMKGQGTAGTQRLMTTEIVNGKPVKMYQNFAKYATPEDSFIAHARLLSKDPRYAGVLEASKTGDLNAIAKAIGDSPYATDSAYGAKIAKIMGTSSPVSPAKTPVLPLDSNMAYLRDTNGNTTTLTAQTPQIKPSGGVIAPFKPQPIQPSLDFGPGFAPSNVGEAISNAYSNISRAAQPTVNAIKSVSAPAIAKVQQIATPIIQKVQQTAAPVIQKASNFVSNAVNSVKNALSNLNPFKKK